MPRRLGWTLLCLLLLIPGARGFVVYETPDLQPLRWKLQSLDPDVPPNSVNRATRAIRYFLARDGYSTTNTAAELNSVRAAFQQWQAVPGSVLKFEEAGLVAPGQDVNTDDATNVVYWAKTTTVVGGGLDDIRGRLGVTYSRFFEDNTLAEADIVLNGVGFRWFTEWGASNPSAYLVESIALHEIGHFLGLDHSPVGAATMMWRSAPGTGLQSGLSADELAAVQALYGQSGVGYATLTGRVTKNGVGILGAAVFAEDLQGNIHSGTVTRPDGTYSLPALKPGAYAIRVAPLDPANAPENTYLIRGREISPDHVNADTSFLPSEPRSIQLNGGDHRLDLSVQPGTLPFRIAFLRDATRVASPYQFSATPVAVRRGDSGVYVGVLSRDLPSSGAALFVSGSGLTLGETRSEVTAQGYRSLFAPLTVEGTTVLGMRSIGVISGSQRVYANGYLEIEAAVPDYNFDGLDDRFQRRYWPVFTAPEAAPTSDPDQDGFTNQREYLAGTNPIDPGSLRFAIQSVRLTAQGAELRFESAPGKSYQVYRNPNVAGSAWQAVGAPVAASGQTATFLDPSAVDLTAFYQVTQLP